MFVDQNRPQPPRRRVERGADPGDAATDHEDVDVTAVAEAVQLAPAPVGMERGLRVVLHGGSSWSWCWGCRVSAARGRCSTRDRQFCGQGFRGQHLGHHPGRLNGRLRDQQHHRGDVDGIARADRSVDLARGNRLRDPLDDDSLARAEAVDDVGHQQVRIRPQDLHEQRVLPHAGGDLDDGAHQLDPGGLVAVHVGDDDADLPCQQVGDDGPGVGPAPVHGGTADARAARHLGERRAAETEVEHTRARRVQDLVVDAGSVRKLVTDRHRV